jgi:predicted transcriptional regulator
MASVTISSAKAAEIDALAAATDRSRDDIVDQAIEQFLEAQAWQAGRIQAGLDAAHAGHVEPAEALFDRIAARHGWAR